MVTKVFFSEYPEKFFAYSLLKELFEKVKEDDVLGFKETYQT